MSVKNWLLTVVCSIVIYSTTYISCSDISLYPPWIRAFKYENDSYSVKCVGTGNLSWRKNDNGNRSISINDFHDINTWEEPGDSGLYLRFNRIRKEDKGEYVCSARIVSSILVNESFFLEVIKPVQFDRSETYVEITEGGNETLTCTADGEPKPDIIWYFEDQPVKGPISRTTYDVYHIVNATWDKAGVYHCQAFQNILQSRNAEKLFHVKVYHKPTVMENRKHPTTIYGFANEIVNVTCEVTAEPKAYFIWYKNNSAIHPKAYKVTMINSDNKSIMQVPLDGPYRYGEYRCEATNELGYNIQTFWLNVTNRPKTPYVGIVKVFSNKVVIKVVSSKETTYYRIQFTEHTYCSKEEKWRISNVTVHNYKSEERNPEFNITGLYPNTKYVLRVASVNQGGSSQYSTEHLFQTSRYLNSAGSLRYGNVNLCIGSIVIISKLIIKIFP